MSNNISSNFDSGKIIATFNGRVIGELQSTTYSITKEKTPKTKEVRNLVSDQKNN